MTRRWAIVAATTLATGVAKFDETVMAVALPSIDGAFDASLATVQWSVTAYVLAFAAFLVPAGRLVDAAGARRVFIAGLTHAQVEGKLGTRDVIAELPNLDPAQAASVATALRDSFLDALTVTMAAGAALVAAGALLAARLLHSGR